MKLLTLNTHSLVEKDYEKKLAYFINWVDRNDYDVISLQEVNQSISAEKVTTDNYFSGANENVKIKEDNHILRVVNGLKLKGKNYYWVWTPIKVGYDIYDEGIGIISKYRPIDVKEFYITQSDNYFNWKVRKVIGIKCEIENEKKWFFSVHLGWWKDDVEVFPHQLATLKSQLKNIVKDDEEVFLMGDFNNPADVRDEAYDQILKEGWLDTYTLAKEKDAGITVAGLIDGWKDHKDITSMRIDFIFTNKNQGIAKSNVVFNGKNGEIISDHFGVEIIR